MAMTIEPALAVELRELLLRVDGASAIAAEAARLAEEAQGRVPSGGSSRPAAR